jgi:general secretion pathway protein D
MIHSRPLLSLLLAVCISVPAPLLPAAAQAPATPPGQAGSNEQINEDEYAKDSNTEINVKNAEIASIVRIFSRKTKRNFILDEKVRGKVSIYLPGRVSAEESLRILDSVLALKGFTAVPIGENLWKIVPSKEARQSTIPTLTEDRPERASSAVVTRLVNLKYVNSQDIQQIISQLISGDGLVNAYTGTNSLILIDSEDNIERLIRIIDELDVPYSNREMTIIPLKYADVEDISQKLGSILGISDGKKDGSSGGAMSDVMRASLGDTSSNGAPAGVPPGAAATSRVGGSGKTVAAKGLEPKIIPDQRTNSIIVVADDDTTARVRALVSQLDSKVDLSGNKFYVYRCQHANAEELAQVLGGLAGGGGGAGSPLGGGSGGRSGSGFSGSPFGDDGSSMGRSSSSLSSNGRSGRNGGGLGSSSGSRGGGGGGGGGARGTQGATTAQLGENLSITADPATNSLIIAASKSDYEKIRGLLAQIDVKRRQALVEATLLEVSIDNNMRASTSFLTSTGGADGGVLARSEFASDKASLTSLFQDPAKLQGLTLAAASAGSLKVGSITLPTQTILVSAAQQNNNVNVLSAPTILATDNEEAQIVVGNNVPFLASTSTNATNLNNTFNQVDRQDVGITLRITPQISSRDYVTLKIYTEVSDLVLSTINSTLGPTTTKRQSETTIIAKDGQMIVTGGLIADAVSESDEGIPYLKDIPILGHAFKSNSQARVQKNLLIFLTPRIIKDQFDARDVTIESRDKLDDVIAQYEVEPKRQQVIRNERIDDVAEALQYEGTKPGTILPSKVIPPSGDLRIDLAPKTPDTVILDGSKDGVLDLSATGSLKESLPPNGDARGSLNLDSLARSVGTDTQGERYIVLEFSDTKDQQKELPFLLGTPSQTAGIIVPRDSAPTARQFFQAGRRYLYAWKDQKIELVARGVFTSIPMAQAAYPGTTAAWYTLSPYEILNLGSAPWSKK